MARVASKALIAAQRERRGAVRRRLCLEAEAVLSADLTAPVIVHELSRTGFLMEAAGRIAIGDPLQLQMADLAPIAAQVIWNCGSHYGCEFQRPLPKAVLSTALLKARPATQVELLPRGLRLSPLPLGHQDQATTFVAPTAPRLRLIMVYSALLWTLIAALIAVGISL